MSCHNKLRFQSRGAAKKHARGAVRGGGQTPYFCGLHDCWHLTSVPKSQHKRYTINRERDARRKGEAA